MSRVKKIHTAPLEENIKLYDDIDNEARLARFPNRKFYRPTYRHSTKIKNDKNTESLRREAALQSGETFYPWTENDYSNQTATTRTHVDIYEILEDIIRIISTKKEHLSNTTRAEQANHIIKWATTILSLKGNLERYNTQAITYIKQEGQDIKKYEKMYANYVKYVINEWLKIDDNNNDLQYDDVIRVMNGIESTLGLTRMIQLLKHQLQQQQMHQQQRLQQQPRSLERGGSRKSRRTRRTRKTRHLVRK